MKKKKVKSHRGGILFRVLYRKWRPKTFDEVIGQKRITETLKNEIIAGKVAHAFLFTGTRGTGKTTCAKILARAVNCESPKNGNPCLKCASCKSIENNSALDVSEIDAASNNGVEDVRSMREELAFTAVNLKYKVYIIDEFHMFSQGAFNALLKILEEPPSHVVFILATTEFHKIPKTIVSRCQKFDFYRVETEEITKRLSFVAEQEDFFVEQSALKIIAENSDGSVRDALSMLDQCAANRVTVKGVLETLGMSGSKNIEELAVSLVSKELSNVLKILTDLYSQSKSMIRLNEELMEFFRCIFIYKSTNALPESLIFDSKIIRECGEKVTLEKALEIFDVLKETFVQMTKTHSQKMELEAAFIKICVFGGRSERFRDARSEIINTESKPEVKIEPEEEKETETETEAKTKEKPEEINWDLVFAKLSSKSLAAMLKNSKVTVEGDTIKIESRNAFLFDMLEKPLNKREFLNAVVELYGKRMEIERLKAPQDAPPQQQSLLDVLVEDARTL
jgi:DNA polymerase-3 subunit gamma/tau